MFEFVLLLLGVYVVFNLRSIHIDFGSHKDSIKRKKDIADVKEPASKPLRLPRKKQSPENTVPRDRRLKK